MSDLSPIPLSFPPTFKFGIADADLQVIGENNTIKYEKSDPTMWSHFALTSGKCYQNQTPGLGIDRYHRWKKDIEIMRKIGVRHYRTSISMSRILKQDGKINSKAIEWYTQYFKALKKAGMFNGNAKLFLRTILAKITPDALFYASEVDALKERNDDWQKEKQRVKTEANALLYQSGFSDSELKTILDADLYNFLKDANDGNLKL